MRKLDTEIWKASWFWGLPPEGKLTMLYLMSACDWGGVWRENRELAEHDMGYTRKQKDDLIGCEQMLPWDDMLRRFNTGETRVVVKGDKWWLVKFVSFHHRTKDGELFLNRNNPFHLKAINAIQSAGFMGEFEDFYPRSIGERRLQWKTPLLADIKELAAAKGVPEVELKRFWNYHQGLGWKSAKSPIVDLNAWLESWLEHGKEMKAERLRMNPQAARARVEVLEKQIKELQADMNNFDDGPNGMKVMKGEVRKRAIEMNQEANELRQLKG